MTSYLKAMSESTYDEAEIQRPIAALKEQYLIDPDVVVRFMADAGWMRIPMQPAGYTVYHETGCHAKGRTPYGCYCGADHQ